jgi:hypothetical protein
MVEVVGTVRITRAQLRQRGGRVLSAGHAQHHHGLAAAQLALAEHGQAGRLRGGQALGAGRPGQDLAPHHRLAARVRLEHVAMPLQQATDLVQAQGAQVAGIGAVQQAPASVARQAAVERIQPVLQLRHLQRRQAELGVRGAAAQHAGERQGGA